VVLKSAQKADRFFNNRYKSRRDGMPQGFKVHR